MAISRLLGSLLMVGCAVRAPTTAIVEIEHPEVVSPDGEVPIEAGSLPVLVRLPHEMRFHTAKVYVDGDVQRSLSPVIRRRWWTGKGVDLIARIPTDRLSPGGHTVRIEMNPSSKGWLDDIKRVGDDAVAIQFGFSLAPRGPRVVLRAIDENGEPRSARFQVFDAQGEPVSLGNPTDGLADPSSRDVPRNSLFAGPEGVGEFFAVGDYHVIASAGIRDGIERRDIAVSESAEVVFTVPRVIQTTGELAADFHVHTAMSSDSFVPDRDRFLALDAAGVDVAVITDHNRVRDPELPIEAMGLGERIAGVPGAELRLGAVGASFGHANAFPLSPSHRAPLQGDAPPGVAFDRWRQHHSAHPPGDLESPLLIQLNHPRGIQFGPNKPHRHEVHGLFEDTQFNPHKPLNQQVDARLRERGAMGGTVLDVDAIEVLNRFSVEGWRLVRADWFALLNRGHQLTATGNSDSHTSQLEPVGFPVNLVNLGGGSGVDGVLDGLREGRVRVSSGPIVSLIVRGDGQSVGPSKAIHSLGSAPTVEVALEAADWVDVPEVRVVVNGEVIFSEPVRLDGPRQWIVPIAVQGDSWVIAEAGWPLDRNDRPAGTAYAKVAPGHVPIGFTNPVFLDGDGDGEWGPIEALEDRGPQ